MINLLADEPMVLLGTVLVVGALLGAIRVKGISVVQAGALFAGLAASAIDERLVIPSIVGLVGLSLFTYCIGLSTGADFVRTLGRSLPLLASIAVVMLALAAVGFWTRLGVRSQPCPDRWNVRRVADQHPGARRPGGSAAARGSAKCASCWLHAQLPVRCSWHAHRRRCRQWD